ncbi:hypothetical protein NOR51B_2389 [Luminiphilus syltensis NOR5-1B]|uniref:Uncharacterized protein n=2 Tax=Luminiphilus TaxID=1341118 RepID=B8KQQ7_9GAMM|nr:hypothetical protein NOR51B_2389 [Luminiphilus syltensis NOR5-1B]
MFALWYAAGNLLAAPVAWLVDILLPLWLGHSVDTAQLSGTDIIVRTFYGENNGVITSAEVAGYQMGLQINTRLVSYAMPFYAALLWASNVSNPLERFARGLFLIWVSMTFGIAAIAAKDLMLVIGEPFLSQPGVPPAPVIAVLYQFSVLLMPTLVPVALWVWQLQGSPMWEQLSRQLSTSAKG